MSEKMFSRADDSQLETPDEKGSEETNSSGAPTRAYTTPAADRLAEPSLGKQGHNSAGLIAPAHKVEPGKGFT